MSAVQRREQLSLPVRVERRKRTSLLTARERVDLFGYLSHEEKAELRLRVDRALRERHNLPADHSASVMERCAAVGGPFSIDHRCRNFALDGSEYCGVHQRMEAA